MRLAQTANQRQPRGRLEPVAQEYFTHPPGYRGRGRAKVLAIRRAIRKHVIEEVTLVLRESVYAHLNIVVLQKANVQVRLRPGIVGCLVHSRDHRYIVRPAVVTRLVVVIERGNRE